MNPQLQTSLEIYDMPFTYYDWYSSSDDECMEDTKYYMHLPEPRKQYVDSEREELHALLASAKRTFDELSWTQTPNLTIEQRQDFIKKFDFESCWVTLNIQTTLCW